MEPKTNRRYLLRWRFDFGNGRPEKYGQWSRPATRNEDMAAFVNKDGIVRAAIEGKDIETREVRVLAECDGWDFVNFQWMAEARMGFGAAAPGPLAAHRLVGLKLVTREVELQVNEAGDVHVAARSEEDKKFHYEGFGR